MMTVRPLPPPLTPVLPDCSVCGDEVSTEEDQFYCGHCDAWWSMSSAFNNGGEWNDCDERGQCDSTDGADGPRCVLNDGHDREHRDSDGRVWAGRPYKVWGYRSPGGFATAAKNEANARWLAGILGADYEVVWRMSDGKSYAWVPVREFGAVSA